MAKDRSRGNGVKRHPQDAPVIPPPGGNFTPGEYGLWGLRQIADYLGFADKRSVITQYEAHQLFMFKRRKGPREVWWTSPQLITMWMLERVLKDRKEYFARKREKERARGI